MIVRVARDCGRLVRDVAAEPFALTTWTWLHLEEAAHRERFSVRARDLHCAALAALAFNDPPKLRDVHQELLDEMGATPSTDEAIAQAQATIDFMRAHDAAHPGDAHVPTEQSQS